MSFDPDWRPPASPLEHVARKCLERDNLLEARMTKLEVTVNRIFWGVCLMAVIMYGENPERIEKLLGRLLG